MIAPNDLIALARFILVAATIVVIVALIFYPRRGSRVLLRRRRSDATRETGAARSQVAALPVRIGTTGALEVLIISTRGSGRWTIPKGWPMRGRTDPEAAAEEAYEEAGVRGAIATEPLGTFEYVKRRSEHEKLLVTVYRLDVEARVRRWRERGQRQQRWLPASEAAECVAWTGLADIIRSLETTRAL